MELDDAAGGRALYTFFEETLRDDEPPETFDTMLDARPPHSARSRECPFSAPHRPRKIVVVLPTAADDAGAATGHTGDVAADDAGDVAADVAGDRRWTAQERHRCAACQPVATDDAGTARGRTHLSATAAPADSSRPTTPSPAESLASPPKAAEAHLSMPRLRLPKMSTHFTRKRWKPSRGTTPPR